MKYDLDWFARNGAKLPQEFEKLRLDEFHKRTDDAKQKAGCRGFQRQLGCLSTRPIYPLKHPSDRSEHGVTE